MNIAERIMKTHLWRYLLYIEKILMVISSMGVILTLSAVVLCRHVLRVNFIGYTEVLVLLAFWMYFIGASYASYEKSHIGADILGQFASARSKLLLDIFSRTVQIIIGIPIIYLSFEMLLFDIHTRQSTVDLEIPLLWSQAPIFIGFTLMTFYAIVYILRDIYILRNPGINDSLEGLD